MAAGKDYFNVGEYEVSQDNRLLAWAEDDVGRRQYTIRFRNLDTGEACPDVITCVSPNLVWADDNRTVFYVENDPETLLRSEEHTSELQSLMRISYAVFCLKKKTTPHHHHHPTTTPPQLLTNPTYHHLQS